MSKAPLHICVLAGEISGDILGARLIRALRAELSAKYVRDIIFSGVGGAQMQEEGVTSLFPMEDLSVMGIAEVLPELPKLLKRISQTASYVIDNKPDILVTIDSPDFSFRVAKKVREGLMDAPHMVHYVAPTVWAWRAKRALKVAKLYNQILCLFPFEPPYFKQVGLLADFVGHPMITDMAQGVDKPPVLSDIPAGCKVCGVFFGSRAGELKRLGPVFHDTIMRLSEGHKDLYIISPTFNRLKPEIESLLQSTSVPYRVITEPENKWALFKQMDFALATSGTVGLELAVAGVPHVIGYKMSHLTWAMIKPLLTTKYAHLGNILLDEAAVPEFIQSNCSADKLAPMLSGLMADKNVRDAQRAAFDKIRHQLKPDQGKAPAECASEAILDDYFRFQRKLSRA